jgi:uncharacterized protein (TIGR02466 family)
MNEALQAIILAEEATCASIGRSNIGGWHSRPDFLVRSEPAVAALTGWITWAVSRMVKATTGFGQSDESLSLSGWAAICRSGAYHAPHSHPESAWSGVYYVESGAPSPARPLSGVLEFLDPRVGAQSVRTPGDPYGDPFRVRPEPGLLLLFPSWLYHWVHPYTGESPRIAVSFNAAVQVPDISRPACR